MSFLPENISTFGDRIDSLTILITVLGLISLAIAEFVLIYSVVRFRKSKSPHAQYIVGNKWKEAKWVVIPVLIVIAMDIFIDIETTSAWNLIKIESPASDYSVRVIGQQFSWQFVHPGKDGKLGTPDDITTTNDLHVPINKNVIFYLQAKEVIHGFSIPVLRLKQDALPGRTWQGWFNATKAGSYEIMCTEICGAGHTVMRATLIVHTQEDFDKWVENPNAGVSLDPNEIMKKYACAGCHSIDGSRLVGPSYKGLFGKIENVTSAGAVRDVKVDDEYLRRSIQDPNADVVTGFPAAMPKMPVTDPEIEAIIKYIKELK